VLRYSQSYHAWEETRCEEKTSRFSTFIQEPLSPDQKRNVQTHMDQIGFGSSENPAVFHAEQPYKLITAARDTLGEINQLPMHSHTFMEIFEYISDSEVEYLLGTHRYRLRKGDLICVPPGTCHQVLRYTPQDTPCVRNLIVISPVFLDMIGWTNQPNQFYLLRVSDEKWKYLRDLSEVCIREAEEQKPHWQDMLVGYIHILLALFVRNSENTIKAEADGIFEELLTYVDENLSQKITLTDTARHFFISERTITREFQKHLNLSFYRYVTQRRLLKAQNLIFHDVPLGDVCEQVGFSDYPTFFRSFKKEYGISPQQMKRLEISPK